MTEMARGKSTGASEGAIAEDSAEATGASCDQGGESSWTCRLAQALLSGCWTGEPLRLADFVA